MSPFPWTELSLLVALILLNGVFSMSELAIVSARPAQLKIAAEHGSRGAEVALRLAADPGKFLSTVQIGITLVGIVAGYVSGATLGGPLGERLAALGLPLRYSDNAGALLAIGLTTYLSLVVGELVPKQVALRLAVPIAIAMARPMDWLARAAKPFVWLLDSSSAAIVRAFGIAPKGEHRLTAEELHMLFTEATHSGVIEEEERAMMSGIIRLASRPVRELMTPRTKLDWLDLAADEAEIRESLAGSPHSLLPVAEGSPEKMVGVVKVRDVLVRLLANEPVVLADLVRKAEVVPDQLDAMDALRLLQASGVGMGMVHDEYGHLEGIVTPADLLVALAGSFASHLDEGEEPQVVETDDGALLVSGALSADALSERLGIELPDDREFATAAGYVLWVLRDLPHEGQHFDDQGWRFQVVDMDGRAIDKLRVTRLDGA